MLDLAAVAALITAIAALVGSLALVVRATRRASVRPPPPRQEPARPSPASRRAGEPAPSSRSTRRILVVDDDASEANAIRLLLAAELPNVVIEVQHDGDAAIEALAERAFDLIVLDVMMSGVSGPEVAGHLRTSWPARRTPVILYSGLDADALEAIRASCGADAAVSKDDAVRIAEVARGLLARR